MLGWTPLMDDDDPKRSSRYQCKAVQPPSCCSSAVSQRTAVADEEKSLLRVFSCLPALGKRLHLI